MASATAALASPPHGLQRHARAVVTVPHLSFATDLLFSLDDVRSACAGGLTTQGNLVTLLKSRIALERHYANELSRMTQQSQLEELEHGTMREALGKLKAQYLNTSVQHRMLANNLEEDVLRPIEALFVYNTQKAQNLTKLVNNLKKQAKVHEDVYKKDYQGFDKNFREATTQFAAAMDAGFSSTVIEHQYLVQLAQIDNGFDESERMEMLMSMGSPGSLTPTEGRPRQKSAAAIQTINNNSQKLVNWLLASDQQRKENVYSKAVQVLEAAEIARRKCIQSWESVEQSRLDMYRTLQSVLTEYQQMAEHRISNLATNLRKHVVFESSALANEQYDWQMIASKIENVDFEGDIREFILENFSHDLETMTVNDLCHVAATSSLVFSPNSKPCRPLKKSPLQIADLAMRRVPYDHQGNRDPLPSVLVTRSVSAPVARARAFVAANATNSSAESTSDAPASPRNLTIQLPSPGKPADFRDATQYRVCLAQDVARAIARAYELRSVQKNSLQSPLFYEDGVDQENNGTDVGSPRHQAAESSLSDVCDAATVERAVVEAMEADEERNESPQTNDCEQEDGSLPGDCDALSKRPDVDEPDTVGSGAD